MKRFLTFLSLQSNVVGLRLMIGPAVLLLMLSFGILSVFAQRELPPTPFRIGERVTYNVSTERYENAGFAEINVVSRGRLNGRDAVELNGRFRTTGLYSAQNLVDEVFVSFVAAESGQPLYIKRSTLSSGLPIDTVGNYLSDPVSGFDVLSLIYHIRSTGSSGATTLVDGTRSFSVSFQQTGTETLSTRAGEFVTSIVEVQSPYFLEFGIRSVRINFDETGSRVPVMIRIKTAGEEFRAAASSIQVLAPSPDPLPTPTPIQTPVPTPTPLPTPTPDRYVNDQPLSLDLPFVLGEKLEYRLMSGPQVVGRIEFHARERRRFNNSDTLLLSANVTMAMPGAPVVVNDRITARVDPITLFPLTFESVFTGTLSGFSQSAVFDTAASKVTAGGTQIDVPVGTHSILSLLYAARSFKLSPSTDPTDPVNDTRVAVFWSGRPLIFVLRPSEVEIALGDGTKVPAYQANITTGDPTLDQLQPKVWISRDARRLPLRLQLGQYILEFERMSVVLPR